MNSLCTKVKLQTSHLTKENWTYANRHLVAKILRELSYEKLINPVNCGDHYTLNIGQSRYRFHAQSYQLDHLVLMFVDK